MAKIVIKKTVKLDFLGEDYKDAYLTFNSMPLDEYETYIEKVKEHQKDEVKSIKLIIDTLKQYFVEGKFPEDGNLAAVNKEDMGQLDIETALRVFSLFTGQDIAPKV